MTVNTNGASQVLIEEQEKDITAMVKLIALQETKINELEADRAFFKSCALSGEVPLPGAEPSAALKGA